MKIILHAVRIKISDNHINEELKNIIEIGNKYKYDSFEKLNINENTKIYFETEKNTYQRNEEYIKFEEHINEDNIYIIFRFKGETCALFVNKKTKLKDVIKDFKKCNNELKNQSIKIVLFKGDNLVPKKSYKTIEELKIECRDIIVIHEFIKN